MGIRYLKYEHQLHYKWIKILFTTQKTKGVTYVCSVLLHNTQSILIYSKLILNTLNEVQFRSHTRDMDFVSD